MNHRIHVIPVGSGEAEHYANLACNCNPLISDGGAIVIHHAWDGREKWERRGFIDQGRPWQLRYEDVPNGDTRTPLFSEDRP